MGKKAKKSKSKKAKSSKSDSVIPPEKVEAFLLAVKYVHRIL
jgi:hypothetical protein